MQKSGIGRFAPLTGPLFVVLAIASFATFGDEVNTDDPLNEIVKFWTHDTDKLYASVFLQGLACVALVFFSASLYSALRSDERNKGLAITALAGVIVLTSGLLFDATVILTVVSERDHLPPESIKLMTAIYNNDFVPMAAGTMIVALSSGLAIVRSSVLPKWLGWIALLLALVTLTPAGFIGFLGTGVWIAIVGIVLTLRGGDAGPATA